MKRIFSFYFLVLEFLVLLQGTHAQTYQGLGELYNYLFNGSYNKLLRPLINQSDIIQVNVTYILHSIEAFDVMSGELETAGYFEIAWQDEFLTWNPSLYGNKTIILLPKYLYWKPRIIVGGFGDDSSKVDNGQFAPAWVTYKGHVHTSAVGRYKTRCDVDPYIFPFDKHDCVYKIFSSVHTTSELNFHTPLDYMRTDNIEEHAEWAIESTQSTVLRTSHSLTTAAVSSIHSTMILRRRPLFFLINSLYLLTMLSVLFALSFFVPIGCGERMSYSITIYLAAVFLLVSYWDIVPRSSVKMPIVSYAILSFYCIHTLLMVWNIYIKYLSDISSNDLNLPPMVRRYVLYVRRKRIQKTERRNRKISTIEHSSQCNTAGRSVSHLQMIDVDDDFNDDNNTSIDSVNDIVSDDDANFETITGVEVSEIFDRLCFYFYLFCTALQMSVQAVLVIHSYH